MITLNSKHTDETLPYNIIDEEEVRHPCWYANLEKGKSKKDYKWKVGCNVDGKTTECSFIVSTAGNVDDNGFWAKITGSDFAIRLIDLFRTGGDKSVKQWIKDGCP